MGVKKFQQISSASLFLSISGILIVFLAPLCEPCPYYCTCSKTVNTCSGFSGQLPNAQLMNSDSYPTEQWPNEPNPEISSSWDFSHGNNITTLDADTFKGLSSITHLNLSHNLIEEIPEDVFRELKNLTVLDLSFNKLRTIKKKSFTGLSNLKVLNLSNNLIWTYPDDTVFDLLSSLEVLNLANPFLSCDCALIGWLTRWRVRNDVIISNDTVCNEHNFNDNHNTNRHSSNEGLGSADEYDETMETERRLNDLHFRIKDCNSDSPSADLRLPLFDMNPPPGSRQLLFEGDSLNLNCSATLPSDEYQLQWKHANTILTHATAPNDVTHKLRHGQVEKEDSRGNEQPRGAETSGTGMTGAGEGNEKKEGDVSVVFWTSGAVTFSSVVISGLMSKQSGYWECSIVSKSSGKELLPPKNTYLMVVQQTADVCPKAVEKTTRGLFTWPKTIAGYQQTLPCPYGRSALYARQPVAFRLCKNDGFWDSSDLTTCEFSSEFSREITKLYMDSERVMLEIRQKELGNLYSGGSSSGGTYLQRMLSVADKLANVSAQSARMENLEDVKYIALTTHNLFLFMAENKIFTTQIIEPVIDTVSNAMSFNPTLLLSAEQLYRSCTMMSSDLHNAIFFTVNKNKQSAVYRKTSHNIAVRAFKIQQVNSFTGYTCALLVSNEKSSSGGSGGGGVVSFTKGAMLECQDGVSQNISTLQMGHAHINKVFAAVKVAPPYLSEDMGGGSGPLAASAGDGVVVSSSSVQEAVLKQNEFFKLQIVVFRNGSLFPSEDVAVVSPVASAKIEALGGQLDPSMSMTAAATPYMTHVKSSDPALSASGVTLKPLQVDLALIYNSDAAGGPGILSGTGMKTSTLTSSSWVLQKTSDVSGASNLGPFDSHYAFKGFWVPSGGAGCEIVWTRHGNMSHVQCDSLATVAITTLLTPIGDVVRSMEAAIQIGCGTTVVFSALIVLTYLVFRKCIFTTTKAMHIVVNFCVSLFFLCSLFAFGNFFSTSSSPAVAASSSTSPLPTTYLATSPHRGRQGDLSKPHLACSSVFLALDYFLLAAALWLILYYRNLCRQFQRIEEKHGQQQLHQNSVMGGGAGAGSASVNGGGIKSKRGGGPNSGGTKDRRRVTRPIYRFYCFSWGIPFVVCLTTTLVSLKLNSDDNNSRCWLSPTVAAITSFVPVGLCCVVCIYYMLRTLLIIPRLPRKLEVRQQCFNPVEQHHPSAPSAASQMCPTGGPMYLDGELELSALTDNDSIHSSLMATSGGVANSSSRGVASRHNPIKGGPAGSHVTATFTVKADSACCRQLRSAFILFLLFFTSWLSASLIVFADFHPQDRISKFKTHNSFIFAAAASIMGMFLFVKFCLLRSDIKQCYIAFVTCQRQITYPKPSNVSHSLYLKHHNSYLSLESGMGGVAGTTGGSSSHPSTFPHHSSTKQSLQNQTTSFTFSESISSDCVRNNGNGAFYNPVDTLLSNATTSSRPHDKCRSVFPTTTGARTATSSRSGSSVRGANLDDDLLAMSAIDGGAPKAMHPTAAVTAAAKHPHHRSQNSLPDNPAQAWQQNTSGNPMATSSNNSDHDKKVGVNPTLMMQQHAPNVPYNTGIMAGRNTPVSIPHTPHGSSNRVHVQQSGMPVPEVATSVGGAPHFGGSAAQFSPDMLATASATGYPPNSKHQYMQSGTNDDNMAMSNRCTTPSIGQPDLLQSYYAVRNAKLAAAASNGSKHVGGMGSRNIADNNANLRAQDYRRSLQVQDDSFSSEDDDSDQDEEDDSSGANELMMSTRPMSRQQQPVYNQHLQPSRHGNDVSSVAAPNSAAVQTGRPPSRPKSGAAPKVAQYNPAYNSQSMYPPKAKGSKDQGETSV